MNVTVWQLKFKCSLKSSSSHKHYSSQRLIALILCFPFHKHISLASGRPQRPMQTKNHNIVRLCGGAINVLLTLYFNLANKLDTNRHSNQSIDSSDLWWTNAKAGRSRLQSVAQKLSEILSVQNGRLVSG